MPVQSRGTPRKNIMINVTQWQPDTCDCKILFEWDTEVPQEERVHTAIATHVLEDGSINEARVCSIHVPILQEQGLDVLQGSRERNTISEDHAEAHHAIVLDENQGKNYTLDAILQAATTLQKTVTNTDGTTHKDFKDGMRPDWAFDANRKLKIVLKGSLSTTARKAIATAAQKIRPDVTLT